MERLTDKNGYFICKNEDCGVVEDYCPLCSNFCSYLHPIIKKLEEYEDAEEQGLILQFPCKVGDTAWVIDEDFEYSGKKKIYEAKWTRVALVQVATKHQFEIRGEVQYQVYDFFYSDGRTMLHGMYVGQYNTKFGKVVFLTKEEAEQALAKMKEV